MCVCEIRKIIFSSIIRWTEMDRKRRNKFKSYYYIAEVRSNEVPTCLRLMTEKIKRGSM